VYIIRPRNTPKELVKIGKTKNMKTRMKVINNALPDNADVLYYIETHEFDKLEKIIKSMTDKYVYIKNKEYYKISVHKLKIIFDNCFNIMNKIDKPYLSRQKILNYNKLQQLTHNIHSDFDKLGIGTFNYDNDDDKG
jgi:hypothetical protein